MDVERLDRGDTIDQGRVQRAFFYSNTKIVTPNKTYDPANEYDNEYFEFSGRNKSKVFEISEMQFTESSDIEDIDNAHVEPDALDIESAVEVFNKVFNKSIDEWNQFEEEKFIIEVRKVAESMYDLQMIDRVVDTVIALSYECQIENF